jgi:dTDP-4-dehydrorhamnose 3,5-epimerase|tara:strand:- start:1086 stop:1607 length:522 start_codon:yes stop_codon:yes gene_type:complete
MKIIKNKFKDLIVTQGLHHFDSRGYLREILLEKNIKMKFKFHIISKSKNNVLRGLHLQNKKPQGKFISVIKGKIFDVAVDLRKDSKTFGKSFKITLSEKNCKSVYIPPGFAHGFQSLDKENIVCYSCTEYRSIGNELALLYNDPFLKIKWPRKKPIISKKDKNAKKFKELFKI